MSPTLALTRGQYESAYMRAIATFSLAIGLACAVQVATMLSVSSYGDPSNPLLALLAGIVVGVVATIVAGIASAVVTLVIGLGLTVAVERLLRPVGDWRRHFAAYFGIGFVAAIVPAALYAWAVCSTEPIEQFAGDWLTLLDLGIVLVLAGMSTSLAWHHVWRASK